MSDGALIAWSHVRENRRDKMASKTTKKRTSKRNQWDWEDFRPDWANEGIERISSELEKWNDKIQSRSDKFRKESQKRIEKGVQQVQDELRKIPGVKRAEELRVEIENRVEKNIDAGVDRVYTRLNLVRLDEVKKLERKIAQLNKKLRALEKQWAA
jgi:endonuclease III